MSEIQHKALSDCLTAQGYQRFMLTAAQRKHLSKLPAGSDERRTYLHDLASNADVLASQPAADRY